MSFFSSADSSKHSREAHLSGQLYFQEPTSMIPPLALQEALDAKKPGRSHDNHDSISIILHISLLVFLFNIDPMITMIQQSTPMIQRQCISHSNASRSICTSLGSLCGSRQQGLKFSCFSISFMAKQRIVMRQVSWLFGCTTAGKPRSMLVEVWVSQGVGQW